MNQIWRRWKISENTHSLSTSLSKRTFLRQGRIVNNDLLKSIFLEAVPWTDTGLIGSDSTAWVKSPNQVLWPRRGWGFVAGVAIYHHGNHASHLPWMVASSECSWGFLCFLSLLATSHPQLINPLLNPSMFCFLGSLFKRKQGCSTVGRRPLLLSLDKLLSPSEHQFCQL